MTIQDFTKHMSPKPYSPYCCGLSYALEQDRHIAHYGRTTPTGERGDWPAFVVFKPLNSVQRQLHIKQGALRLTNELLVYVNSLQSSNYDNYDDEDNDDEF